MRILSFNANGLRSAASKGFFDWFPAQDVDVMCVQETKAQEHQLRLPAFLPEGYTAFFRDATTKKCTIVDTKPTTTTTTIVDNGIFKTKTEAETGMKTTKVCTE